MEIKGKMPDQEGGEAGTCWILMKSENPGKTNAEMNHPQILLAFSQFM